MTDVIISKLNESWMIVHPKDEGLKATIWEMFTFFAPNFRFHPLFKRGMWDGKIRLYNKDTEQLYIGFYKELIKKLKEGQITYQADSDLEQLTEGTPVNIIEEFLSQLKTELVPHPHQIDMLKISLNQKRVVAISPTASGKSFAYYMYVKFLLSKVKGKILIVVPTISLVLQMKTDFIEYDKKYGTIEKDIHTIMGGDDKDAQAKIYISTWQSIYKLTTDYFKQFSVVIIDECHMVKADSLTKICEKTISTDWRLGATGTLDDWKTHHFVITGLLGSIYRITTTNHLIETKLLSPVKIYSFVFKYPLKESEYVRLLEDAQGNKRKAYAEELKFVYNHQKRNNAICKLTANLKQNTLILFTRIEHGKCLYKKICELTKGVNKVFYVEGSVNANDREDIRAQFERDENCIGVVSVQCFGVGINIKNLHNVVLPAGGKSKIRILQQIGRGLRLHPSKILLNVIDIVDDMSHKYPNPKEPNRKKSYRNFLLQHYKVRQWYYEREKFPLIEKFVNMETNGQN